MTRRTHVAHVWVDDFFVRVERQACPALEGRPVVIGGSPGSAGRVVAASVEAMASGVLPGMTLAEAAAACPDAAFRPGHLDRVLEASALVEETVRRVAGAVEWCAIDEAVLDLAAMDRGRARRVAENLREAIRRLGHDAAIGVADTRTAARVAARLARPQGVLVVLPGCDGRFLAGLDVACLDEVDLDAQARLRAADVATLGELAALAPDRAAALLGRDAATLVRLAAGLDARTVTSTGFPRRISRTHAFTDVPDTGGLNERLDSLLASACAALTHFGCLARSLTVRVEDAGHQSLARTTELDAPTASVVLWRRAAGEALTRVATGREVRAMSVTLGRVSRTREQLALFDLPHTAGTRRW